MANPQPEDGHIDIANQIADKFCMSRVSGEEWQVLWVILRKTYGWHKKEDHIGLGQFSDMTGLTRQHALRALKKLEAKHVITVTKNGNTGTNLYRFIKNFDLWKLLPKKDTVLPNLVGAVTKNGVGVLPNLVHTKETTQKKIQKKVFIAPTFEEVTDYCCERKNNIDPSYWIDFYESKGWMVGRNKMKDWKAAVRTWEKNNVTNNYTNGGTVVL